MTSASAPLVAVHFFPRDRSTGTLVPCHLANRTLTKQAGSEWIQYEPGLKLPIRVGSRISAEVYGQPVRSFPNNGAVEFALDATTRAWMAYDWNGCIVEIYTGEVGDTAYSLTLAYSGRVVTPAWDVVKNQATISITEARLDLDRPLVERTYGETISNEHPLMVGAIVAASGYTVTFSAGDQTAAGVRAGDKHQWTSGLVPECLNVDLVVQSVTATSITYDKPVASRGGPWAFAQVVPDALIGRPIPYVRGFVGCYEPDLIDEPTRTYFVTDQTPMEITRVTVGGIDWDEVESDPVAGQYTYDADRGTVTLGGSPMGAQVRVDVLTDGWDSCTHGAFMREVVEDAGGTVLPSAFDALDVAAPWLIGIAYKDPVNKQQVLNEAAASMFGLWAVSPLGQVAVGLLVPPYPQTWADLDDETIGSLSQKSEIDPAWRVRVEYARNQTPLNQFVGGITGDEEQAFRRPGLVATPYENHPLHAANSSAVDVPLIRSWVYAEADAIAIRDRVAAVASVTRRLYQAEARIDTPPYLYLPVGVEYGDDIDGFFLMHSLTREIGLTSKTTMELWG